MRNLFLLAFGLFFTFVTTGCGAIRTIAADTCTQGNYNRYVCPGILEEALDAPLDTPTTKTPTKAAPVEVEACTASGFLVRRGHVERVLTRSKGACTNERLLLQKHLRKAGPGVKCRFTKGQILCAGLSDFGHTGGILLILLTLLWGRGLRNAVVGIVIVLVSGGAYGACTSADVAGNKVAAQYGLKLYDCDKDEVPQASKDAVFAVIWRGFVAKGGLKMGMSKSYIHSRWERAEGAFWAAWKDSPLWQAQVAAAICVKETNCGVTVKFSEWETHRFESVKNGNGSVDCGITQINSAYTDFSCDELQDLNTAFQEQRRHIFMATDNESEKAYWEKNIHRYNGAEAYEYGRIVWQWSGASFGWSVIWLFLLGLFRRRKGTYMVPALIKNNAIIEVGKEKFVLDCHVIIFTIYDGKDKVVGRRFSALAPDGRRYVKNGWKGYYVAEH